MTKARPKDILLDMGNTNRPGVHGISEYVQLSATVRVDE